MVKNSESLEKLISPVVNSFDCQLVDLVFRREGKGKILRILIEHNEASAEDGSGVTVDHCAKISRDVAVLLDSSELIEGRYTLEVSSAGLDRPLRKIKDYKRFAGSKAKVNTTKAIERRRSFTGKLLRVESNNIYLELSDGENVKIPIQIISKAKLVPEIRWN